VGSAPTSQRTYEVPVSELPQFGLDPVSGEPCEFALSIGIRTLNQVLLALADDYFPSMAIQTLDVGAGPQPITAELIAALVPAFHALPPATPLKLRVQPTLPPMLMGQPSTQAALSDLYVGQVLISIVRAGAPSGEAPYLSVALDVRGDVGLSYAASATLGLQLQLAVDPQSLAIVANGLQADEESFGLLLAGLAQRLVPGAAQAQGTMPIPGFQGLNLWVQSLSSGSGYVTAVLDLESNFTKPDLIVESIESIGAVDVNNPWETLCRIKNVGSMDALGSVVVGASVSPDNVFMNGNDLGIGQSLISLGNGLRPGESQDVTIHVNGMPGFPISDQTLFVLADVPILPGGTGNICERTEMNNHRGQEVLLSAPDAQVLSITVPPNVVGGVGPRPYRVRVRRNNLGTGVLHIPVGVLVGIGAGSQFAQNWIDLMPGEEGEVDVWVGTPASHGTAPQVNVYTVTACTNLASDSSRDNDCMTTTVGIAVPYWDLRYSIVIEPNSAMHCGTTHWDVRVTNVGNIPSMNVCSITGIGLHSGAGNWNANLGLINFTTPNIAPAASWTFHVNNYGVNCAAFLGTQYVKTEVNYAGGCFDNFSAGNYAQRAITIY
jgi:hypothetical protein